MRHRLRFRRPRKNALPVRRLPSAPSRRRLGLFTSLWPVFGRASGPRSRTQEEELGRLGGEAHPIWLKVRPQNSPPRARGMHFPAPDGQPGQGGTTCARLSAGKICGILHHGADPLRRSKTAVVAIGRLRSAPARHKPQESARSADGGAALRARFPQPQACESDCQDRETTCREAVHRGRPGRRRSCESGYERRMRNVHSSLEYG